MATSIEEDKFAGGVAVITGAGAGIGMGLARRLGATDISPERAEQTAAAIRDAGGRAEAMRVDVSQPAELDRLAASVFERHGAVRLLINNAGIETMGFTWEISAERWDATLDINIHGVVHGCRAFIPHMIRAGQGRAGQGSRPGSWTWTKGVRSSLTSWRAACSGWTPSRR